MFQKRVTSRFELLLGRHVAQEALLFRHDLGCYLGCGCSIGSFWTSLPAFCQTAFGRDQRRRLWLYGIRCGHVAGVDCSTVQCEVAATVSTATVTATGKQRGARRRERICLHLQYSSTYLSRRGRNVIDMLRTEEEDSKILMVHGRCEWSLGIARTRADFKLMARNCSTDEVRH